MSFQRKQEDKRRLKKLYDKTGKKGYGRGAWYDEDKNRIIKYSAVSEGWYWKRHSNKQIRRWSKPLASGNSYRKVFDYWCQQF